MGAACCSRTPSALSTSCTAFSKALCRCGLALGGDTILGVATSARSGLEPGPLGGLASAPGCGLGCAPGAADVAARSSGSASTGGASMRIAALGAGAGSGAAASWVVETGRATGTGACRRERLGDTFDDAMSCRGFCATVAARERFVSTAGGPARATCGGCAAEDARFAGSAGLPRTFDEFLDFVVGENASTFVLAAGASATAGDPPDAASTAGATGVSDSAAPLAAGAPTSLARASSAFEFAAPDGGPGAFGCAGSRRRRGSRRGRIRGRHRRDDRFRFRIEARTQIGEGFPRLIREGMQRIADVGGTRQRGPRGES